MAAPEDVRAKLARLRRETPPAGVARAEDALTPPRDAALDSAEIADEPISSASTPIPRLPERLRARLVRARASAAPEVSAPAARTVGMPDGLEPNVGPRGPFVARTTAALVCEAHGAFCYDEARAVEPDTFGLLSGDPALASLDLTRAVFVDTETTGLEGGAGTYVFLVGLGWFDGGRFVVQQSFLRDPEDEAAVLAAVAERIAAAPAVVSFFGKVFDRHRLEDKMRVHGVVPPFAGRPHLDLCFPLRRLTKGVLPDGRLQTLERELLGLVRADDMPGSLAPAAWFDLLAGRAHRLEGVFRHNLDDVRSLATMAAYLGRVGHGTRASGAPLAGCPGRRAFALARAHEDRRDTDAALACYGRLLDTPDLAAALDERERARAITTRSKLERRAARKATS